MTPMRLLRPLLIDMRMLRYLSVVFFISFNT